MEPGSVGLKDIGRDGHHLMIFCFALNNHYLNQWFKNGTKIEDESSEQCEHESCKRKEKFTQMNLEDTVLINFRADESWLLKIKCAPEDSSAQKPPKIPLFSKIHLFILSPYAIRNWHQNHSRKMDLFFLGFSMFFQFKIILFPCDISVFFADYRVENFLISLVFQCFFRISDSSIPTLLTA